MNLPEIWDIYWNIMRITLIDTILLMIIVIFSNYPQSCPRITRYNLDSNTVNRKFFLPNDLSSETQLMGKDRLTNLQSWINAAPTPNFPDGFYQKRSIFPESIVHPIHRGYYYNYLLRLQNPKLKRNSLIWINSFIVPVEDIKSLPRDCQ